MKHLFALMLLLIFCLPALADEIPANCESPNGEYYQANWVLRNNINSRELQIVDWQTGDLVRVLEGNFSTEEFAAYAWSPNCRFVAGRSGDFHDTTVGVWDVVEGRRLASWEHVYLYEIRFSPQNEQILIETRAGAFLWTFATDSRVQLTNDFQCMGYSFATIAWNHENRLFIGVQEDWSCRYAPGPIHIYNMDTGAELGTIQGADFRLFGANRLVNYSYQTGSWQDTVKIYDLPSLALIYSIPVGEHHHLSDLMLSSDERYFVVNDWGIRVYDIPAQSNVFLQDSNISHSWRNLSLEAGILSAYHPDGSLYQWSVETGEEIN
jgi:hypothetical protein